MNETENMKEQALKSIQTLSRVGTKAMLVQHLISSSTQEKILSGMPEMSWEKKNQYAIILTSILKTSKTEDEVLKRAEEAKNFL